MVELQSTVSQRATAAQLTTGMMGSINDGTKTVAGNIGRGETTTTCRLCKARAKRP